MKKIIKVLVLLLIACYCNAARNNVFNLTTINNKQLTDLPTMYINTVKSQAVTSKDTYIYATMIYVDGKTVTEYDSLRIRGRGNSTWTAMPKKPYRIKFQTKQKFLGKSYANAKDWTLLANCSDKSMIHDALTRDLGEFIGMKNTPAAKFVDLCLNGTYIGTYQASDQVEVRAHRVNITEQDEKLTSVSNITGGYLLEVNQFAEAGEKCFYTSTKNLYVRIHYPDEDYLQSSQTSYISNYVNSFEKALFSANFDDSENGYRPYIDSTSLINWYVATELTANTDGYHSIYFYKDQDDPHLYFGPLWDFDLAYNNFAEQGDVTNTLMMDIKKGYYCPWVPQMWKDKWFARKVNKRWRELIVAGLNDYLSEKIDSLAAIVAKSEVENYKKWSISSRYWTAGTLVLHSSYQDYIDDLHDFINNRIIYLTSQFASMDPTVNTVTPTSAFQALSCNYYRLYNHLATSSVIDVPDGGTTTGTTICLNSSTGGLISQQWQIMEFGGCYQLINRAGGLALKDPSGSSRSGISVPLILSSANSNDKSQLWSFVPQTNGYYNLKNVSTGKILTNSDNSPVNGNYQLSCKSKAKEDSVSEARLWLPVPDVEAASRNNASISTGIKNERNVDYALIYSKDRQVIYFVSQLVSDLTFTADVYNNNGIRMGSFKATDEFGTSSLPHGVYIVSWYFGGRTHSSKFVIQ